MLYFCPIQAALEAFKKDISDNPDLAKQYNVRVPLGLCNIRIIFAIFVS